MILTGRSRSFLGSVLTPLLGMACLAAQPPEKPGSMTVVSTSSASPLIQISLMIRAGSAHDPPGKEGLAYLTGHNLLEGGFGNPADPVTKEQLALMTRPWGRGAKPSVRVAKEVTTFYITVPGDVLEEYLSRVLEPLLSQPLFQARELDRIRAETVEKISGALRYEDIEGLGLNAIDHFIFEGTSYAHLSSGSVQGLANISRDDLLAFYTTHYRPANAILALNKGDADSKARVSKAMGRIGQGFDQIQKLSGPALRGPLSFRGRHAVIVSLPNADSTGLHAGFPISVTRHSHDYWPLYVANVFFGVHRDGFSHLFREIRQKRGYNYGDYSYIEHFASRPRFLFPPFNTPRSRQYFSIWIRPVAHRYALHLLKGLTWELENFIRKGLTEAQVAAAKNKAKVLYLNLAETGSRLLNVRLDDAFYGQSESGYLAHYLERLEAVTVEQVNSAIRAHLKVENLKYLLVTHSDQAEGLAKQMSADLAAAGKTLEEYQILNIEHQGKEVHAISPEKLEILQKDAVWRSYRLGVPRDQIRIVPVDRIFETGEFVAP